MTHLLKLKRDQNLNLEVGLVSLFLTFINTRLLNFPTLCNFSKEGTPDQVDSHSVPHLNFPGIQRSQRSRQTERNRSVTSLHLSSVILAAKSSFFRTLFTCGLKEACNDKPVVLNVTAEGFNFENCLPFFAKNVNCSFLFVCSEEASVVDLLHFIYTGTGLFCFPKVCKV